MADITRIGREHLIAHGVAGLSLRAVARDLGVVSSAVYRYVRSRDDLLTLLVVDAYTELADEVDAAIATVPVDQPAERFRALARATRTWAVREPARYALLYGTPVAGYHAPAEQTTGPGTRVILALARIVAEAHSVEALTERPTAPPPSPLAEDLAAIRSEMALDLTDGVICRAVFVWSALFGAVSFEVFGQYGASTFADPEQVFECHLTAMTESVGLSD